MSLLDVRNLVVELPTAAGWIRPVNDVSLQLGPAESLGLVGESKLLPSRWRFTSRI